MPARAHAHGALPTAHASHSKPRLWRCVWPRFRHSRHGGGVGSPLAPPPGAVRWSFDAAVGWRDTREVAVAAVGPSVAAAACSSWDPPPRRPRPVFRAMPSEKTFKQRRTFGGCRGWARADGGVAGPRRTEGPRWRGPGARPGWSLRGSGDEGPRGCGLRGRARESWGLKAQGWGAGPGRAGHSGAEGRARESWGLKARGWGAGAGRAVDSGAEGPGPGGLKARGLRDRAPEAWGAKAAGPGRLSRLRGRRAEGEGPGTGPRDRGAEDWGGDWRARVSGEGRGQRELRAGPGVPHTWSREGAFARAEVLNHFWPLFSPPVWGGGDCSSKKHKPCKECRTHGEAGPDAGLWRVLWSGRSRMQVNHL